VDQFPRRPIGLFLLDAGVPVMSNQVAGIAARSRAPRPHVPAAVAGPAILSVLGLRPRLAGGFLTAPLVRQTRYPAWSLRATDRLGRDLSPAGRAVSAAGSWLQEAAAAGPWRPAGVPATIPTSRAIALALDTGARGGAASPLLVGIGPGGAPSGPAYRQASRPCSSDPGGYRRDCRRASTGRPAGYRRCRRTSSAMGLLDAIAAKLHGPGLADCHEE